MSLYHGGITSWLIHNLVTGALLFLYYKRAFRHQTLYNWRNLYVSLLQISVFLYKSFLVPLILVYSTEPLHKSSDGHICPGAFVHPAAWWVLVHGLGLLLMCITVLTDIRKPTCIPPWQKEMQSQGSPLLPGRFKWSLAELSIAAERKYLLLLH